MGTDTTERIDRLVDTDECIHPRTDYRIIDEGATMLWSCDACGDRGTTDDLDPIRHAPTDDEQADDDAARRAATMHVHQYDPWRGEQRVPRTIAELDAWDAIAYGARDAGILRAFEADIIRGER